MSDSWDKENWELKTLGEIATDIYSGSEVTKAQLKEHGFPAIRYCEIHSSNLFIKEYRDFVDIDEIKRKRYIEYGDLLIVNVSENLEDSGKTVAYLNENKCLAGNHVITIKHKQNPKYLAYATSTDFYKKQVKEYSKKGIVCDLAITKIRQIQIPLPPRHIQDKIVDHLDKLLSLKEELKRELTSELKERIKQYQYYLNLLIVGREEEGKFIPYPNNRWDSSWYLFWKWYQERSIKRSGTSLY